MLSLSAIKNQQHRYVVDIKAQKYNSGKRIDGQNKNNKKYISLEQ